MADASFKKFIEIRDHKSSVYNLNDRSMLAEADDASHSQANNTASAEEPVPITVLLKSASKRQPAQTECAPDYPREKSLPPNLSAEFADRNRSRPTGRPHVVGLDGRVVTSRSGRMDNRNFHGFFPSLKLRALTPTNQMCSSSASERTRRKPAHSCKSKTSRRVSLVEWLRLVPELNLEVQPAILNIFRRSHLPSSWS